MAGIFEFNRALTRLPGRTAAMGLRRDDRDAPDLLALADEHAEYVSALVEAGLSTEILKPLDELPDSLFVEDTALVFTEGAILLRPGAPSRGPESAAILPVLEKLFPTVLTLPRPGFVDGGDVLVTPHVVMVGLSERTDRTGAADLVGCLEKLGRKAKVVTTPQSVLHFKSACTLVDEETVVATPALARSGLFSGYRVIETPEGEEAAANCLRVNDHLLVADGFPRLIETLRDLGPRVSVLKLDEIMKLDAGLTCLSLRWWEPE